MGIRVSRYRHVTFYTLFVCLPALPTPETHAPPANAADRLNQTISVQRQPAVLGGLRIFSDEPIGRKPRTIFNEQFVVKDGTPTRRAGFVGLILNKKDGDKKAGLGSGSLICPNVVMTAGHVVNRRKAELMSFTMGKDALKTASEGNEDAGVEDIVSFNTETGKTGNISLEDAGSDIALIKLKTPMGNEYQPGVLGRARPHATRDLKIIGYGRNTAEGGAGIKREGRVTAKHIFLDNQKGVLVHGPGPNEQTGMPGDSGAPVFQPEDDGSLGPILGVHSAGDGKQVNYSALVAPLRAKIVEKLKEWCPGGFSDRPRDSLASTDRETVM